MSLRSILTTAECPFAYAERLPRGTSHDDWIGVDLPWVSVADVLVRLSGESAGADEEVTQAVLLGIPVFVMEDGETIDDVIGRIRQHFDAKSGPAAVKIGNGFARVAGVGPDAPTVINAAGGKQSGSPYRADLLPALAVLAVAGVLKHGADRYGADNWRVIPAVDHLNHALVHIFAWLAGDKSDDHLEHAACRVLMGLEMSLASGV